MPHVGQASTGLLLQEHKARVQRGRPQTHSPNSLVSLPTQSMWTRSLVSAKWAFGGDAASSPYGDAGGSRVI